MTTLQKLLNQSQDAPPDISATNYLDTDPTLGLVEAQNAQIDKNIKDAESFFQQKIDIYNAAHSQKMKNIDKVINFIPTAASIYQKNQELNDDLNLFRKWDQNAKKDEVTDKQLDSVDVTAEDINNEYNVELNAEAGNLEANGGPKFARNVALLSTLDTEGLNVRNTLDRYASMTPALLAQAQLSLKLPDGTGWGDISTPDQLNNWIMEAGGTLFSTIRSQNPEITYREFRKHWLPKYRESERNLVSQWTNTQTRLVNDAYTKGRQNRLYDSLGNDTQNAIDSSFGKNGFIKQRAAYYEERFPGKGLRYAREEWRDDLISGLQNGYASLPADFLSTEITWNDGSKMSFEKKFPVDALKIRTAALEGDNREADAAKELDAAKQEQWLYQNVYEYEGPRTLEWIRGLHSKFQTEFKTAKIPEELKTLWTDSLELDQEKYYRLLNISERGGIVTDQDISTIENPTIKAEAVKLVNQQTISGVPKLIYDREMELLKGYITKHSFENDLTKAKTPKFIAIHHQAQDEWVEKYNELKAQNQPDSVARAGAREYVNKRIKDGDYDSLPSFKYNLDAAHDLSIARHSLIVDKGILFSKNLLENEAQYLDKGDVFIKSNYKKGEIPQYYRELSKLFPDLDPHDLLMTRLVATGRHKDDIGRYKGVENSRDFTDKPTSSKIFRNSLSTDNFEWITENITNPSYEKNGGYDAVTKNGKFVELEKPLSEHTIGEVLSLTRDYDSFGMYNITSYGLKQILTSPSLPFDLDDPFDEDTQKALVLGRLKQKANMGHTLNGQPGFKRLVNIPKEDQQKFYDIVGELPPMNQLGNLLPGVAKALVEDTLQ